MAAIGRSGILVVILVFSTLFLQNGHHDSMLEGVPSGKTRVLDLSYAINDKLVPWPGDEKFFEAKVNASNEKKDRKSTRLNSSHLGISYAVFCLKKKSTCLSIVS